MIRGLQRGEVMVGQFFRCSVRRTLARSGFVLVALLASACASGGGGGGSDSGSLQAITAEEIASSGAVDGWDVIQRIRPSWTSFRSGRTLLYVDNQRRDETGGAEQYLRNISASTIARIEWVRPEDATRLPQAPTGQVAGAIMVTTRGGDE